MRFSYLVLSATAAVATPVSFPLADNNFPNLNTTALQEVSTVAGGTIPNGALPTNISASGTQALQLIAANELFEVAYFSELLSNITNGVDGYEDATSYDVKMLTAVLAQEELHALAANGVLTSAKQTAIQPCQYNFPVTTYEDAILLAQTFTDLVLGVLPSVQALFAQNGGQEPALIPIVGSIIAQEGEQVGYYRALQEKVASAAPFLTGGAAQFAYTALSQFIVEGSCPNLSILNLTAFPALYVETIPGAVNSTQLFSISGMVTAADVSIAYISGQNVPVTVPISGVNTDSNSGKTYFFADFPYEAGFARGLTIGALVTGANVTFGSSADVAAATLYGPALIEID